jgi:hypothetical protein
MLAHGPEARPCSHPRVERVLTLRQGMDGLWSYDVQWTCAACGGQGTAPVPVLEENRRGRRGVSSSVPAGDKPD